MNVYDIALVTEAKYVNPTTVDWYTQQVLTEDGLVQQALEDAGYRVIKVSWDNATFDWSKVSLVLIRTTWDYSARFHEFKCWLERVAQQTCLINSPTLINWNIDKCYLQDLHQKGITIPPTHIVAARATTSLSALQRELGWEQMVLKPAVSAGGRHTYKVTVETVQEQEALFQDLIAAEAMVLQPFLHNIVKKGEVAFMVINGKVTHAVLKKAKKGEFRVQDDFGGSVEVYQPSEAEISFAEQVVAACPEQPIYARVDMVWDNHNQMALSEIELIEPEMWFRNYPLAAQKLAVAIGDKMKQLEATKL